MEDEYRTATLVVVAVVATASSALYIAASGLVAVGVLGVMLCVALVRNVVLHRRLDRTTGLTSSTMFRHPSPPTDPLGEDGHEVVNISRDKKTAAATRSTRLREDESAVFEKIAADADTSEILRSISELLGNQFPGSRFRITTDDVFDDEAIDRTWSILDRTDKDLGWVLQAVLADPGSTPDQDVISLAQDLARLALDKERSQAHLRYQADHDSLTGLLSRRAVLAALDDAIKTNATVGLVYCDIDKFKQINDSLGHRAGDDLLIGISHRLLDASDEAPFDCKVGRLGGDEYLIVASGPDQRDMVRLVEGLSFAIRAPFNFGKATISTSLSLGATYAESRVAGSIPLDSAELLRESDLALYQVKRNGRNDFRFFDAELRAILAAQKELQEDLSRSISSRSGIHANFQPQFDRDRNLVGFEALGRWYRQGRGLVPPDEFIPVAKEHGLMAAFDKEVFSNISQSLGGLRREGRTFGTVAINVSAERLERDDFVQSTLEVLRRTSIDPRKVVLEITESTLLQDVRERGRRLEALRAWGVRIAIDDFGTGYSSLSYLRELPVDIVKLDKEFVSDIESSVESQAIVQAILSLATVLKLSVVAEGVEREQQFEVLRDLGCDTFQGFLLGRPLEMEDARELAERVWVPDPFSAGYEWSEGPPVDASSLVATSVVDGQPDR
jgi:diguanylate cyclase (GGDEF)-like protein